VADAFTLSQRRTLETRRVWWRVGRSVWWPVGPGDRLTEDADGINLLPSE
jgi:hypothetical protein